MNAVSKFLQIYRVVLIILASIHVYVPSFQHILIETTAEKRIMLHGVLK